MACGGLPLALFSGLGAASVEELVSLHDVQAYRRTRCQISRYLWPIRTSHGSVRRRSRSAGGTAVLAGIPIVAAFSDVPIASFPYRQSALENSSERIRGKRAFLYEFTGAAVFCHRSASQHSYADPSVATSSSVGFGRVWTAFTAGALPALPFNAAGAPGGQLPG